MKGTTVITRLILATLPLVGYGCTSNQTSPAATAKPKATPVATNPAGQAVVRVPKITASQSSIKISGSQGGTIQVPAEKGGYLIKYRYKGYGLKLEADSPLGPLNMIPGGQSAGSDGWTQFADLTSFTNTGEQLYRISATEPFEIELLRLPLPAAPDSPPKSYSGSGLKVLGPLSLKAGSASFKVSCPDLKQAGFIAELYDARTAQNKGIIALGTGPKVAETKKLQVAPAGDYLVKINANGRSDWTIEVTQEVRRPSRARSESVE